MSAQKIFIEKKNIHPSFWVYLLFFLIVFLTFGIGFFFMYSMFMDRITYLNRKTLFKLLSNNSIFCIEKQEGHIGENVYTKYVLKYKDELYLFTYYYNYRNYVFTNCIKSEINNNIKYESGSKNYIGFFAGDFRAINKDIKIMKLINKLF